MGRSLQLVALLVDPFLLEREAILLLLVLSSAKTAAVSVVDLAEVAVRENPDVSLIKYRHSDLASRIFGWKMKKKAMFVLITELNAAQKTSFN